MMVFVKIKHQQQGMMNIESSHEKNIENDDRKHKTIE